MTADSTGSICDVLPGVAALLDVPGAPDPLGLRSTLGGRRRVVVVLVDGMGDELLELMAPHAPLLAAVLRGAGGHRRLDCTFPSTTPTSLVSLGTGVGPGEHGVLGFTVRVPGTNRVLTHIQWRGDPPPASWQPVPTWFERIVAAGRSATAVLPAAFAGSGLTDAIYRGARFCGVAPDDDYAARLTHEVSTASGLVYGYTSVLDTAAHEHGVDSPQWRAAATQVDALLDRVVEALPDDAVLLVTADHGALNVGFDARVDLDTDPRLSAGIAVVAGEPRVRYLHTLPGAAQDVVDAWADVLGTNADVLHRDDAVARGLFGPVRSQHLERIGDVVVVCTGDAVVLASRHEPPEVATLVGFHGGLTSPETAIPLLTLSRP